MITHTKKQLIDKGWHSEEAKKSVKAMESAVKQKTNKILFIEKALFWIFLVIIIIANLLVSLLLIPVFLRLNTLGVYITVAVLGLVIGLLLDFLIRDIENLEKWHHYLALILIPLIAIISIVLIGSFSNQIYSAVGEKFYYIHNLWIVGIFYAIFLVLPYVIKEFVFKKSG